MRVAIGSDHAGVVLKAGVARMLADRGHTVEDLGTDGTASVDYPDFAHAVAEAVVSGKTERGVLVCGTGIGMSIAANRHAGVRAAVCHSVEAARLARAHNDANLLCLGARIIAPALVESILETWLDTPFEGGRHARRVSKVERE